MSTTEAQTASPDPRVGKVDMKLEVHIVPVSDVDRSKQFYERLGWRLDDDAAPLDGLRIVQFTPPGSGTSVTFGKGLTAAAPGSSLAGLVVSDIEAAHGELVGRGIDASDVWHGPPFPPEARQPGVDPVRTSAGRGCRRWRARVAQRRRTMDFLVEFEVDVPAGTSETEVKDRERAEAVAATKLADEGHLLRAWKRPLPTGETNVLGLYRAESESELDGLLSALPLYEWMTVTVTGLERHPNDPAAAQERAVQPLGPGDE
jgi:muconolactone delta-isomerase